MNLDEALEMLERGLRGFLSILTILPGRIAPQDHAERTRITGIVDVAREEMAAVFEARAAELRTGTG